MKGKKVTLKDIAQEAGVSSATVSYVLNYSEKEKISHATRLRVFEAAKRLHYVPDMTAKALANKKSELVGIIVNLNSSNLPGKIYQYYDQIDALQGRLHRAGYDAVLLSTQNLTEDIQIGQRRSLDAAFILDLDSQTLQNMTNHFYVPLIFIDGHLEDPLFREVLGDYDAVFAAELNPDENGEDAFVAIEDYSSDYIYSCAQKYCPAEHIFVNKNGASLPEFLQQRQGWKGIAVGEVLGLQVESLTGAERLTVVTGRDHDPLLNPKTRRVRISREEKAEQAVAVLERLLALGEYEDEQRILYVSPS